MADLWHQSNRKPQEASGKSVPPKSPNLSFLMKGDILPLHQSAALAKPHGQTKGSASAKGSLPSCPNLSDVKEVRVHGGTRSWLVHYKVVFYLFIIK